MRTAVVSGVEELEVLGPAWHALSDDLRADVFVRPTFCIPWWLHLGRGSPNVVTVHDGGRLVGLAPLHRRGGLVRRLRLFGHGLGTVSQVLVEGGRDDVADALWAAALSGRRPVLVDLMEHRAGVGALGRLAERTGARSRCEAHDRCPVIVLDPARGVDGLLAGRSKTLRRTLRVGRERAAAAGGHSLEVVRAPAHLEAVLDEVRAVFDAAEAARPRLHLLAGRHRDFTEALLRRAAVEDRLRLYVGRVGDRAVSADVGFAAGGQVSLWAGRFDPAAADLSAGHLALAGILEGALADGCERVDLLLGDDDYKRRWTDDGYGTVAVLASATPGALRADAVAAAARRRLRPAPPPARRSP